MTSELLAPAIAAYVYVSYIAAPPEKIWQALTSGDWTRRYWGGIDVESDWKAGSPLSFWSDASHTDKKVDGEVLRADPPRELSYTFHHISCGGVSFSERPSRVTFTLEPQGETTKLTLIHDDFDPAGQSREKVSNGWPLVLSGLKSLLETGRALDLQVKDQPQPAKAAR